MPQQPRRELTHRSIPASEIPTSGISVSLTAGTLQAIRERVGKRGVSAFLEKAAQRQIERDNLDDLIADFDKTRPAASRS
ncbi:hypothetical protein [Streptomyces sp. NPDC026092]|uniref:hypothetical protein n=1 Tax=Streptomyces sp. NPDC026092 TaxID=3154797 RepID=UPI0033D273A7